MLFHPDPHWEGEFRTDTGGDILIVQYPGPTTREPMHRTFASLINWAS